MADLFLKTHYELYSIPSISPLEVALSSGLSALKTSTCSPASRRSSGHPISTCPACSPELNELAQNLPCAHAARSHLVDALTGEAMEGDNEPVVLPNGRLYGSRSLKLRNEQPGVRAWHVRDPQTGEEFPMSSIRKAYVL